MALSINTNNASLIAQRNLARSGGSLELSIQRLSSGLRINSARDDAAGLAISERMSASLRGMAVAKRNANDGISALQVADGVLSSVGENLQRMRELAVQASTGTLSVSDRNNLDLEYSQLVDEIKRLSETGEFNGVKLLNNGDSNNPFKFELQITHEGGGGDNVLGVEFTNIFNEVTAFVNGEGPGALNNSVGNYSSSTAQSYATATVTNGATVGANAVDFTSFASGTLTDANGDTVAAVQVGTAIDPALTNVDIDGDSVADYQFSNDGTNTTLSRLDKDGNIVSTTANLATPAGTAVTASEFASLFDDAQFLNADGEVITAASAVATDISSARLDLNGDGVADFEFNNAANFAVSTNNETISQPQGLAGATAGAKNAQDVITNLDALLDEVNNQRAKVGAGINRIEAVISNLETSIVNLGAARGRIVDADFAAETANLTRTQILQQAGTAMLAQANQLPANVLSLLG